MHLFYCLPVYHLHSLNWVTHMPFKVEFYEVIGSYNESTWGVLRMFGVSGLLLCCGIDISKESEGKC